MKWYNITLQNQYQIVYLAVKNRVLDQLLKEDSAKNKKTNVRGEYL